MKNFFLFVFTFVFLLLTFVTRINAQVPDPYVECNDQEKEEWHSLRPYQASPCNKPLKMDEQALLCGNNLTVNDTILAPKDPGCYIVPGSCQPKCPGACGPITCKVECDRNFVVSLNANQSELPIAGNTELVKGDDPSLIQSILGKLPGPLNPIEKWRLKGGWSGGFDQHKPPEISDYPDPDDYYEAYQEWRGKVCLSTNDVPFIGSLLPDIMICGELLGGFLNPNFWADLYPKIPYSSTEDRIGKARVNRMLKVGGSLRKLEPNPPNTIWHPDDPNYGSDPSIRQKPNEYGETPLYFPHMEENLELSSLLQTTYLPQELLKISPGEGPGVEKLPSRPNPQCKIANVRYNPGDQLFGETQGDLGVPNANVTYKAIIDDCQGSCTFPSPFNPNYCLKPVLNCPRNAVFSSDVSTYTPLIDELYEKTITSETSILRRFLPRVGSGAPIEKIEDIPASTAVEHISKDVQSHVTTLSMPAEFYIPHFGSIYDYLLQGLQTLLRPKEFPGEPAGLAKDTLIPETAQANEYLSWFLNGTLYRAEQNPLDVNISLLDAIRGKRDDSKRVTSQTGPLNKLLSQHVQWRNIFQKDPKTKVVSDVARVPQTDPRAKKDRHNQIVGCTIGKTIPLLGITIGGFPVMCETESQIAIKNLPSPGSGTKTPTPTQCTDRSGDLAKDTIDPSCKLSKSQIGDSAVPPLMKKVFEVAGAKNGVPPDLIAGLMYAEGGFEEDPTKPVHPACYVEYGGNTAEYEEDDIENAIKCEFPNCNPDTATNVCNYDTTQGPASCINGGTHYGPYQQCPNNYNPCNFYDASMKIAENTLFKFKYGVASYAGKSCLGYALNSGSTASGYNCQKNVWSCSDVITALYHNTGFDDCAASTTYICQALDVYGACGGSCP